MKNKMQFPNGFIEHIKNNQGFSEQQFRNAHDEAAPVSIRTNPQKPYHPADADPVAWCRDAWYLQQRPAFVFDPLFHAGAYYVQEASSMFLDHVLRQIGADKTPARILDLCAAPGGKSTLIASAMHPESVLFSNEVIRTRVSTLRENITKWGNKQVVVTGHDAAQFQHMTSYFDIIVVDAPCSGSGLFRKDADAMQEWSMENVVMCSRRQQRILEDIMPSLKPGGYLIYATCSYSREEDTEIVASLLRSGFINKNNSVFTDLFPGIQREENGFTFYPDKIRGEGFFISLLQKEDENFPVGNASKPWTYTLAGPSEIAAIQPWLHSAEHYRITVVNNIYYAWTDTVERAIAASSGIFIQQAGIAIGELKNGQLIPDHALAMSDICASSVSKVEVDSDTAIQFLRKNTIQIEGLDKGWHLITFHGISLGWIKAIPGRINNYYPTDWRIRK